MTQILTKKINREALLPAPEKAFAMRRAEYIAALDAMTDETRQRVFDDISEGTKYLQTDGELDYETALRKCEQQVLGELVK